MLQIIKEDSSLLPFQNALEQRHNDFNNTLNFINDNWGSLTEFASVYNYFGFRYSKDDKGYFFREYLPNALEVSIFGDFNAWDRNNKPLQKKENGVWEGFFPDSEYANNLTHGSEYKIHIKTPGSSLDRLPAYLKYAKQTDKHDFNAVFLRQETFKWSNKKAIHHAIPFIYEAHIGMATEEHRVGTYNEFTENVLPRVKKLGYNYIQLMAVHEHPYYASFGYQVSNFFAPSSRFGTPVDLKNLIDKAHGLGIGVILDIVHSHSVNNLNEGIIDLDGTDLYLSGTHPDWDSSLFNYSKIEVKQFLLANVQYWLEEFKVDGFRFDGVSSMFYHHFGHKDFLQYDDYFKDTNNDAIIYLQLANQLIHNHHKNKLSICEDMSGMPGACLPIKDGGIGFDFRLAMGIPDYWIKTIKNFPKQGWPVGDIFWQLVNRRHNEKSIAYSESHDQALVGDQTILQRLLGNLVYTNMSVFNSNHWVELAIDYHKIIRFITITLGGEGYMNFMGNEFGHPEWIDFPRAGNNWSYQHARRQWSLVKADDLQYKFLENFDKAMLAFIKKYNVLELGKAEKVWESGEVLLVRKGNLLFAYNFGQSHLLNFGLKAISIKVKDLIFNSDSELFSLNPSTDHILFNNKKSKEQFITIQSATALVFSVN